MPGIYRVYLAFFGLYIVTNANSHFLALTSIEILNPFCFCSENFTTKLF